MRLRFPPLAGGVIQGLNDAGIETFVGDYPHFVVRECAQNSLDAAASHEKAVRMGDCGAHSASFRAALLSRSATQSLTSLLAAAG